jgi:hypothetical protein
MNERQPRIFLVTAFLVVIGTLLPLQLGLQIARGERPLLADLFLRAPNEENLRSFERNLESSNWIANQLRPQLQRIAFTLLSDAGARSQRGRDGWLFYRPGVRYLTEKLPPGDDPATAIRSFRDQLAERGIQLLVVPVPGKATIYPDRVTERAEDLATAPNAHTRRLVQELGDEGIEVLDLTDTFRSALAEQRDLYLVRDTHWSPHGVRVAAQAIAARLLDLGWVLRGATEYQLEPMTIERRGDLVEMMQSPPLERLLGTENVQAARVMRGDEPYKDDPESELLILGDSFLRIYQGDEPGSAGLIAHLAYELGLPLASIVNDGGASTLVRQQLSRTSEILAGKRVVIWQFIERDIRFGVEGWQDVRLR